jgi:glycosyltransferase involved in cell wall biosynthesis
VAPLLASAELFLLPSLNESFGLSALEALACGVPVVATNVGGLPEVIRDGVTGALRPVGAVEEMVDAGIAILKDQERWRALSDAAAADAHARFAIDNIVAQYESFYARTLAARG